MSNTRIWLPPFPLDIASVLAPFRRGKADPTLRTDERGVVWLTGTTADGQGTLALRRFSTGEVEASAWGAGSAALLAGVPALLGAGDDDTGFEAHHDVIARAVRTMPGLRLGSSLRVWDALVPAVLEQKVTGYEARRSWRELCRRFGEPAKGPVPSGLRLPPTPEAILSIADWDWHSAGVDLSRRRTLIGAARVADRLSEAGNLGGRRGRELLTKLPGIGVWTAAEVARRAWGDADAVSFGDFHIPSVVGRALIGRPLDDAGLRSVLEPYAPQRARAVRYIEAAGYSRPRFGPRNAVRDYRDI